MSGVDLPTVKEILGHREFEMTLRYSHLAPAHKAKALDRLGNAFKQIEQQQAEQQAEAANSSQTATNLECFRNVLLVRSGRGFSVIDPKSTPNQEINANSKLVEAGGIAFRHKPLINLALFRDETLDAPKVAPTVSLLLILFDCLR
jgi:hypothetical protein